MGVDHKGIVHAISEAGVSADHPHAGHFEFLVAPTTKDQFNAARLRLIPIACWRVDDIRFAFDSSFVAAEATTDPTIDPTDIRQELKHLASLVRRHPGCPISVFGHADPVGSDEYNKLLSGRRAMAIYALLITQSDPDRAVALWRRIAAIEHWGASERHMMESTSGLVSGTPDRVLFKAYMQQLCPADLKLSKNDFLAHGSDAGGKGDFQGCGEFNPVLVFSREKQKKFDEASRENNKALVDERNSANRPNRRVMVLIFREGSRVDPAKWPCPRATEGTAGCRRRFWSDGEKRRNTHLPDKDRRYEVSKDTIACRFYDRMTSGSPCEPLPLRTLEYGVLVGNSSWTNEARLVITSQQDTQKREFTMQQGKAAGDFRIFHIRYLRPGILYDGVLRTDSFQLNLFAGADLGSLADPENAYNLLPPHPEVGGAWL
jgi:hypothetical protein